MTRQRHDPLALARHYLSKGWHPVQVYRKTKKPIGEKWQKVRITTANIEDYFSDDDDVLVGVQLGPKSRHLNDVDLDCREALICGAMLLPETNAVFGRKSKRRSHWEYTTDLDSKVDKAALQFKDVRDGKDQMLIELRIGGGGKGAQTVFPGSTHESGEPIEWEGGEPDKVTKVDGDALLRAVKLTAVATLLARHWPAADSHVRHDAAITAGGFLARAGLAEDEASLVLRAAAAAAGDDEVEDRAKTSADGVRKHENGEPMRGLPSLIEAFGEAVSKQLAKWLDYKGDGRAETLPDQEDSWVAQLNEEYCVVRESNKSRVLTFTEEHGRQLAVYLGFSDFRNLYMNKYVPVGRGEMPLGKYWLQHPARRQYKGVTFEPCKPTVIDGKLNLWRGWGVEPQAGDWSRMRQHIKEVLASEDEEYERYILNFAAWCVQNPGVPAEVALVFKGRQGTGRGLFARSLGRCFGQHYHHISSIKHLTGDFNAHLRDCCLLFADEAFWPGYKQHEGALKRLLTEETLFIEPKGVNGFEVRNMLHVVMASNEKWVVPASLDQRRFEVFAAAEHQKQDPAWFKPIYAEMEAGGCAAMLHDLLARDLDGWHPREIIKTAALHEQQILSLDSLDPHEAWWFTLLSNGILPGKARWVRGEDGKMIKEDTNPRRAKNEVLFEHAREAVPRLRFESDHMLARTLREHGCRKYNTDGRGWEFPPLLEARAKWKKQMPDHYWRDAHELEDWQERD